MVVIHYSRDTLFYGVWLVQGWHFFKVYFVDVDDAVLASGEKVVEISACLHLGDCAFVGDLGSEATIQVWLGQNLDGAICSARHEGLQSSLRVTNKTSLCQLTRPMRILLPFDYSVVLIDYLELLLLSVSPDHSDRKQVLLSCRNLSTLYHIFWTVQNEIAGTEIESFTLGAWFFFIGECVHDLEGGEMPPFNFAIGAAYGKSTVEVSQH